jgi:hypothetical protein
MSGAAKEKPAAAAAAAASSGAAGEGKKSNVRKRSASSNARKSEAEIRQERLAGGALLLSFALPNSASSADSKQWKSIEKYGFQLDRMLGCLIPYELAQSGMGRGRNRVASALAAKLFCNEVIDESLKGQKTQYGWERMGHYSHLCHFGPCANPFHIVAEEAWCNWKRNYCGAKGSCDCGQDPPCLRPYRPPEFSPPLELVKYSDVDKAQVVARVLPGLTVRIMSADNYAKQDDKHANRNKRLRKTRKHNAETNANIKKAASKAVAELAAVPASDLKKPDPRYQSKTAIVKRTNAAIASVPAAASAAAAVVAAEDDDDDDDDDEDDKDVVTVDDDDE